MTSTSPRIKWKSKNMIDYYRLGKKIGEGTYGEVFEAGLLYKKSNSGGSGSNTSTSSNNNINSSINSNSNNSVNNNIPSSILTTPSIPIENSTVAIKRMFMKEEKEGFPITAIREIKLLQRINNKNIVKLLDVISDTSDYTKSYIDRPLCFVFEYVHHDLTGLREMMHQTLPLHQLKHYFYQILKGIAVLHSKGIIHRDLKGANILVTRDHEIKIADFGLARPSPIPPKLLLESSINPTKIQLTNPVVTLWYRAPEILAGDRQYTASIDMWSAGCLLAELMTGHALFPGKVEIEQVERIFKVCGTPTKENWPGFFNLPQASIATMSPLPNVLREDFERLRSSGNSRVTPMGLNLLEQLLSLNPDKRLTAQDALLHDYFYKEEPIMPLNLPTLPAQGCYEFIAKTHSNLQNQSKMAQEHNAPPLPPIPQSNYHNNYNKQNYNSNSKSYYNNPNQNQNNNYYHKSNRSIVPDSHNPAPPAGDHSYVPGKRKDFTENVRIDGHAPPYKKHYSNYHGYNNKDSNYNRETYDNSRDSKNARPYDSTRDSKDIRSYDNSRDSKDNRSYDNTTGYNKSSIYKTGISFTQSKVGLNSTSDTYSTSKDKYLDKSTTSNNETKLLPEMSSDITQPNDNVVPTAPATIKKSNRWNFSNLAPIST